MTRPKVTFGIIVLNGEPFTRYSLRALYPYAHEIIVVEGGGDGAEAVTTNDGHSIDTTLRTLWEFKRTEDPEDKLTIVTRDGHWPTRDELGRYRTAQSQAFAERATGEYLWLVDIDEFYQPAAIERVLDLIRERPDITQISFQQRTFWGSLDYWVDCWALRRWHVGHHRVFKWGPGYTLFTHEPPVILDSLGVDLREGVWLTGRDMRRMDVKFYHYSIFFPSQVHRKCVVYHDEKPEVCAGILEWARTGYDTLERPYRVHNLYNSPSWLRRFRGTHPPVVVQMIQDIESGVVQETLRDMSDVERLMKSPAYALGRISLSAGDYADRFVQNVLRTGRAAGRGVRRAIASTGGTDSGEDGRA